MEAQPLWSGRPLLQQLTIYGSGGMSAHCPCTAQEEGHSLMGAKNKVSHILGKNREVKILKGTMMEHRLHQSRYVYEL